MSGATEPRTLLIFGLGYAAGAVARRAVAQGWRVVGTTRAEAEAQDGIERIRFEAAGPCLAGATHVLSSVPPDEAGDPVLRHYAEAIRADCRPRWIGYFSTTGVYGDRAGGWVDEETPVAPASERAARRLDAETAWTEMARQASGGVIDLLRIAGIYGPGRSAFDGLRRGEARRILAPGHCFGRIHRDDIAGLTLAAIAAPPEGRRVLNLTDDLPAESAEVTAHAARLLGVPVPEAIPLQLAWLTMRPMARSFWADNRKVSGRATQQATAYRWRYPTYKEGLAAVLNEESKPD